MIAATPVLGADTVLAPPLEPEPELPPALELLVELLPQPASMDATRTQSSAADQAAGRARNVFLRPISLLRPTTLRECEGA